MRTWILIAGRRFAGKDTAADTLAQLMRRQCTDDGNIVVVRTSFAEIAKREFCSANNLDYTRIMSDRDYKERHRAALIDYAMSRRGEDEDYFVRMVEQRYPHVEHTENIFVIISDHRFPNEQRFLAQTGDRCITMRVEASEEARRSRGWTYVADVDDSVSELGSGLEIDYKLANNSDCSALERAVIDVLRECGLIQ